MDLSYFDISAFICGEKLLLNPQRFFLLRDEFTDTLLREFGHRQHVFEAEGLALGGALDFDEAAGVVHHEIHVGSGVGILGVIEVQYRLAAEDATGDGGDQMAQGVVGDQSALAHVVDGVHQRDATAGDRGGARAAVGLDHVAVDGERALAQLFHVHGRAQGAPDQALDLHGAPALFAHRGLARHAAAGGTRQYAVFGRDPALTLALEEVRHLFFYADVAHHARLAELDEHRAFGVPGVVSGDPDVA